VPDGVASVRPRRYAEPDEEIPDDEFVGEAAVVAGGVGGGLLRLGREHPKPLQLQQALLRRVVDLGGNQSFLAERDPRYGHDVGEP
jgi:hypothetical protein